MDLWLEKVRWSAYFAGRLNRRMGNEYTVRCVKCGHTCIVYCVLSDHEYIANWHYSEEGWEVIDGEHVCPKHSLIYKAYRRLK